VVRVVYQTPAGSAYREINYSLDTERWIHLATSYDGVNESGVQLYIDGQQQTLGSPSSSISGAMVDSDEALYFGARQDGGIQHFNGNISNVALYDRALSATEIETMMVAPASVSNLIGNWKLNQGTGIQALDTSGNGLHGTVDGATWANMCPEEDLDEDGVAAWEDCDDTDPTISEGNGVSALCAGTSCKTILDDGLSTGNGTYWIDPDGSGAFVAYCDMTTDGGGWTRVVSIQASSKDHAGNVNAVGDVSTLSSAAKLTDTLISLLNTQGHWWYECGVSKDVYVRTASGNFDSNYSNGEDWSIDNQKDGNFECSANRSGYVFADYPYCAVGHSDYGSPGDGSGCYVDGEGWGLAGALWAR
jgi:hypothetical protein